jgi:hypothetical protein
MVSLAVAPKSVCKFFTIGVRVPKSACAWAACCQHNSTITMPASMRITLLVLVLGWYGGWVFTLCAVFRFIYFGLMVYDIK